MEHTEEVLIMIITLNSLNFRGMTAVRLLLPSCDVEHFDRPQMDTDKEHDGWRREARRVQSDVLHCTSRQSAANFSCRTHACKTRLVN